MGGRTGVPGAWALALGRLLRHPDRRALRDARGVEAALGLRALGAVPRLEAGPDPFRRLREAPGPPSAYAEAALAVLAAATAPPGRKVVLVTSSLPGEGKTTLALSLAALAARSGRVLVVDLDLRQPNVHRALGAPGEGGPGVVEHVADGLPLEAGLRRDALPGLDYLPVGARTEDPTGLIESERMRDLLDACRASYDRVVIDCAPVGVITDARVAARLADAVLFVARWGRTDPRTARDALRALRDVGVEPAGAVLTQADAGPP